MNKKAQAQIITTVLIILLVLAAIVIVWQVVRQTVTESTGEIEGGTDCLTIGLEIVEDQVNTGVGTSSIMIRRTAGSGSLNKIRILIDGTAEPNDYDASTLKELETTPAIPVSDLAGGEKIEIAAVLTNGKICEPADEYTVPTP